MKVKNQSETLFDRRFRYTILYTQDINKIECNVLAVGAWCWVHLVFHCPQNFVPSCKVIMLLRNLEDSGKFHLKRLACDAVDW